jgi:hypothetical protein
MASGGTHPTIVGSYVGTAAPKSIEVGFKPKYIKFVNGGNGSTAEFMDTMDADSVVTHDSGTDALVTSEGVTLTDTGFDLGTNAVVNGSTLLVHFMAIA